MTARMAVVGVVALCVIAGPLPQGVVGGLPGLGSVLSWITDGPSSGIASATPPGYDSVVLADSPAAYYRLDETSGTTAADSSGHSVTGTYQSNVTLGASGAIAGDSDAGISTTNSSAAVTASAATFPSGSAARTMEVWFKTTSTIAYPWWMQYGGFGLEGENGAFVAQNGSAHFDLTPPYSFKDGAWHLADIVYDGTKAYIYYDSDLIGSGAITVNTPTTATLAVGGFVGSLDEAAVYPAALTPDQIAAHWTRGGSSRFACAPTPSGGYASTILSDHPTVYYRLDDIAADSTSRVMFDSSGNCHNGAYGPGQTSGSSVLVSDSDAAMTTNSTNLMGGFATTAAVPQGTAARTYEAWVKTTDSANGA